MDLWTHERRVDAEGVIGRLILEMKDNGWPLTISTIIGFKELIASASHPLNWPEISQVLQAMSASGEKSTEAFERRIEELRSKREPPPGSVEWTFAIPFFIDPASEFKPWDFRVLDKATRTASPDEVKDLTGDLEPVSLREVVGRRVTVMPAAFLVTSGRGQTPNLAWTTLAPAFDTLRGTIELTLGIGQWQWHIGLPQSRARVPHPPWMLAKPATGRAEGFYFMCEEPEASGRLVLNDQMLQAIGENLQLFRAVPPPSSILSLIADCLRLYTQAMDARWPHQTLLGLWQLAETITLSQEVQGNTGAIVDRIAWHGSRLKLAGSGYEHALRSIARRRNDVVHHGIQRIDDFDIDVLKVATETALLWLFKNRERLATKTHLREFYRLREAKPQHLEATKETVDFLQQQQSASTVNVTHGGAP